MFDFKEYDSQNVTVFQASIATPSTGRQRRVYLSLSARLLLLARKDKELTRGMVHHQSEQSEHFHQQRPHGTQNEKLTGHGVGTKRPFTIKQYITG